MSVLGTKTLKGTEKFLYGESKTTFLKTCVWCVFELFMYKNHKTNGKHPFKNKYLNAFELVTYKIAKMHAKNEEMKRHCEKCVL